MSVSKLETLPNEILIDILEKYINGVDILVAIAYQQNRRFDQLITQCQRLYFNFANCRKNDFCFCMGLLPAYFENIEELVLSEQNTPGQIHAFFTFFPSFAPFQRLRRLYLHIDARAVDWAVAQRAMLSLSATRIDTLSIKIINTEEIPTLHYVMADMFQSTTLKRLSFISDFQRIQWNFVSNVSSKIEYLTISHMHCQFEDLQYIFRCASQLKYLNVRLTDRLYYGFYKSVNLSNSDIVSMPMLRTLILSFNENDHTTLNMLEKYLTVMPALHRLEITAHRVLLDASAWETLLQTSLPLLTHFILKTTTICIDEGAIHEILSSFDTPFWVAKKNFYMVITKHQRSDIFGTEVGETLMIDPYEFDPPVIQWWIVPLRAHIDNIPTNDIKSLAISDLSNSLSLYHYFDNVKYLVIHGLDKHLLKWITEYVNYSRIVYLDVPILAKESITVTSLLPSIRNISSLRTVYDRLLHQDVYEGQENCLKYLDISLRQHAFEKKDLHTISILFPGIEHLAINTINLSNVPMLINYLPHIRSLTFKIIDSTFSLFDEYEQRLWEDRLRQAVNFLFQRDGHWITIWIDEAALTDPYWQTCTSSSSHLINPSKKSSTLQRISSFFK